MILTPEQIERLFADPRGPKTVPPMSEYIRILNTLAAHVKITRKVAEMPEPELMILDVRRYLAGFSADGPSEVPNVWHEIWLQARKLRGM